MKSQQYTLFAFSAFLIFQAGESLRCWSCSSDEDGPCSDYFNTTRLSRYQSPYQAYPSQGGQTQVILQECNDGGSNLYVGQQSRRAVCMKKKQTNYGHTMYLRQCRFIQYDEKVGTCPSEGSSNIDFCELCDYDGCNGAESMHKSFLVAALVPFCGFVFWK